MSETSTTSSSSNNKQGVQKHPFKRLVRRMSMDSVIPPKIESQATNKNFKMFQKQISEVVSSPSPGKQLAGNDDVLTQKLKHCESESVIANQISDFIYNFAGAHQKVTTR